MHHDEDDLDATVIRPRGAGGRGARVGIGAQADARPEVGAGGQASTGPQLGAVGQVGTVRPVRAEEVDDPFGDTVLVDALVRDPALRDPGSRVPAHRRDDAPVDAPAVPVLPPAPPVRPAHVPSIRVGGRVIRLDRPVVVGRRPGLPRVVRGPTPELLTVPSPTGQVSASHLLVHAAGETAVVDDLHSTNGTVIRSPGGTPHRMASGTSNVVLTGTVVEIGDGNTIEILSPFTRLTPPGPVPTGPSVPPRERS